MTGATDSAQLALAAADALAQRTGAASHEIAIVLGSGWVPAIDALGDPLAEFPATDLPGFSPPAVEEPVVHGVRTAAAAGCRVVILTNACGGLRPGLSVGDPVLISDHLNLTWHSPLLGERFVDLTDCWSARLRALVHEIDPSLSEGVYAQFPGPQYETPAEVRMAGILGADLVGMSTVLEAVAARAEGCELLGISLVTNLAAGLGDPLDHEDVLAVGRASATRMGELLGRVLPHL